MTISGQNLILPNRLLSMRKKFLVRAYLPKKNLYVTVFLCIDLACNRENK